MSDSEYIVLMGKGNYYPLKERFKELGSFWTGFCYAFPVSAEKELATIVQHLPNIEIHRQPLPSGHTLESFKQIYNASFYKKKLKELESKVTQITKNESIDLSVETFNQELIEGLSIDEVQKEILFGMLQERDKLKESIEWSEGIAQALNAQNSQKVSLKFVSELLVNYLEVDAHPKQRLMYWVEKDGSKRVFIHKGIVALLVAAGGVGKTHLVALLALCKATGIPFLGQFEFDTPGSVCLIIGENSADDTHRLIRKTRLSLESLLEENKRRLEHERFGLYGEDPFIEASKKLMTFSVHGRDACFIDKMGKPTDFYNNLFEELKAKEPQDGWDLIILDPISRFAGLEAEKDNALATAFIACIERLTIGLKGNPTILLSHHKAKSSISDKASDQTAARGASAFTDGCRWQSNIDINEEGTIFHVVKTNFTAYPPKFKLKKDKNGSPQFNGFIEDKKGKS